MKAFELTLIFNRYCNLEILGHFFNRDLHVDIKNKIKELSEAEGTGYETYITTLQQNTTLETAEFFTDFFSDEFIFQNVVYPSHNDSIKEALTTEFRSNFKEQYNLCDKQYSEIINPDFFTATINYSKSGLDQDCIDEGAICSTSCDMSDDDTDIQLFRMNYIHSVTGIGLSGAETTFVSVTSHNSPNHEGDLVQLIKERYAEGDVVLGECMEGMVFTDHYRYTEIKRALDECYEWGREEGMPTQHNLDAIRLEAGWLVHEKPSFETIDGVFQAGSLVLKSTTYTNESVHLLDIGAITLTCGEATYKIDIDRSTTGCEDGKVEIDLLFNDVKEAFDGEEVFEGEKFNISTNDLFSNDLKATIFVDNSDSAFDFEFSEGSLFVNISDEEITIPLTRD